MRTLPLRAIVILGIAGFILTTTSCKKRKLNRATTTSEDNALAENLFDDVFSVMEEADAENGLSDKRGKNGSGSSFGDSLRDTCIFGDTVKKLPIICREVLDTTDGWPRRLTIDFGSGYTGKDSITRKGMIILERTGRYREVGSVHSYTTDNYFVDDHKVEGTRAVTNSGLNSAGNSEFNIDVTGGKITTPDNETITWESHRTREWIEGASTIFNIFDDVYSISGNASGVNREGRAYTVQTTTPLRIELDCRWIVSGVIEIEPDDLKKRVIDYGSGVCDDEATVTVGRKTRTIKLRR